VSWEVSSGGTEDDIMFGGCGCKDEGGSDDDRDGGRDGESSNGTYSVGKSLNSV
jgi:hypothetical protein